MRINGRLLEENMCVDLLDALGDKYVSVRWICDAKQNTCRAKHTILIQTLTAVVEIVSKSVPNTPKGEE